MNDGTPRQDEEAAARKEDADFHPVPAVGNSVRLMRALAAGREPMTLTEVARSADVPMATALKILRTLAMEGLVLHRAAEKTYQLGAGIVQLARAVPALDADAVLRERMTGIATRFDCLTALWQITRTRVILRERALADRPLRLDMQVTQRMPVYLGAVGRAVAAARAVPRASLEAKFDELRWEVPIPFERYWAEVAEAGRRGYAVDAGHLYKGVHAVASVAAEAPGEPVAAISAIALSGTMDADRLAELGTALREACRAAEQGANGTGH
ncbi:hypothetical protein DLJ53_11865 [Acuticoccus sediminis]|uniref:IclR family transcriptional regulator n=1 Tax=Acuticoccus sediminis TaxID=2184697 RepID=A0A8B2P1B4_9HYPH|nr:IclR family transcriptional regulator C-terminal domain-containing protein [Acuticoccus sediminis]RAI02067.1 hypothetical protein DLJ53_11865 [Acuticoccus sediminis]